MSLSGDLKHFPIIDIIQLLHGARKSGLLRLTGDDGESQLVFHKGDLVSASYLNGRVRIGQVLVGAGAITEEQLARALEAQQRAGNGRKPLVITLLEQGAVDEHRAYNCLESLIEMTIVQALTWTGGRFSLEMDGGEGGEGRRFPRNDFPQRILLNSQGILMESLRILDEKMRDGTMDELLSIAGLSAGDLEDEQAPGEAAPDARRDDASSLLQQLLTEQRGMMQRGGDQSYRTTAALTRLMDEEFPEAGKEQRLQLVSLLAAETEREIQASPAPRMAVVVITRSAPVSTMVRSLCHREGIYAVAADGPAAVPINVRLLLCQGLHPVIFLDIPHGDDPQETIRSCLELRQQSQASLVLAACAGFWNRRGLQALASGIRSIIPRPCPHCAEESAIRQALAFCSGLPPFLRALSAEYGSGGDRRLFDCISRLHDCATGAEITGALLEYLMEPFERALLFRVTTSGLTAEQGFGIRGTKREGITPLDGLLIGKDDQEIFERVTETGQLFYGFHSDSTWPHQLYRLIGRPESPEVLLFPLIRVKAVTAFIYADSGALQAPSPSLDQLQALLRFTTSRISILAYRQKLKSMLDAGERSGAAREQ